MLLDLRSKRREAMPVATQIADVPKTQRSHIDDFLAQNRIAMVGVSRNARDFTRMLYKEFIKRGYAVVPVNPSAPEMDGHRCYESVRQIEPPVPAVLLMTKPEVTDRVIEDCLVAGVTHVWMYRASGRGAVSSTAVEMCRRHGVKVIVGECPFMFFPKPGFIHGVHGWIRKIAGSYPK